MITEIAYKILIYCIIFGILQTVFFSTYYFEWQPAASSQKPAADGYRKIS
jgi:hypothetical protein